MARWIGSNFNFYTLPLTQEGIHYISPEHYFQAMKTTDPIHRALVAAAPYPPLAKKLGKTVPLRANWNGIKLDVMKEAVRHRLHDPTFKEWLLAQKDEITENNYWHDTFWGVCHCHYCNHSGLNNLGKILMALRDELLSARTIPIPEL